MISDFEFLKDFVKNTLSCQCPDTVFDTIVQKTKVKITSDFEVEKVFVIGNRLLIFVVLVDKFDNKYIKDNLPKLIIHGINWRDDYDLNRFRLVIFSKFSGNLKTKAKAKFKKEIAGDERLHLHLLDKNKFKKELADIIG
jgi:hypothetical protein